jgi:hypothetical protein
VRRAEATTVEVRVLDEGTWLIASIVEVTGNEIVVATHSDLRSDGAVSIVLRVDGVEHIVDGVTLRTTDRGVSVRLREVPDVVRVELERRSRTSERLKASA